MKIQIVDEKMPLVVQLGDIMVLQEDKEIVCMVTADHNNCLRLLILDGLNQSYDNKGYSLCGIKQLIAEGTFIHYSKNEYILELFKKSE